jgi:hypothetical protein
MYLEALSTTYESYRLFVECRPARIVGILGRDGCDGWSQPTTVARHYLVCVDDASGAAVQRLDPHGRVVDHFALLKREGEVC